MNTTKSVYSRLFKEETQLASHEVHLATLDMVKAMTQDSLSLYKRGQEYAKEMEAFIKKSRVLNAEADALSKGLEKELNEFEKQAKDLGLNVSNLPEFKKAVDSLGPLDNIFKMTQRFK